MAKRKPKRRPEPSDFRLDPEHIPTWDEQEEQAFSEFMDDAGFSKMMNAVEALLRTAYISGWENQNEENEENEEDPEEAFSEFMESDFSKRVSNTVLTLSRISYAFGWKDRETYALEEAILLTERVKKSKNFPFATPVRNEQDEIDENLCLFHQALTEQKKNKKW